MYVKSNLYDRQMMAFSVPPSSHPDLDKDFAELSRIHFYLGHQPIDFMIKAVEKASPEEIEKGNTQIYFAYKEISQYLESSLPTLYFTENQIYSNKEKKSVFDTSFKNILNHTLSILNNAYEKPTYKHNVNMVETMIILTHEVLLLKSQLEKTQTLNESFDEQLIQIKNIYSKLYALKEHYSELQPLKLFEYYEVIAKDSLISQLQTPFSLDFKEINSMDNVDSWFGILKQLHDQKENMKKEGYLFNTKEANKLKESFLINIKSFNRLLSNGIINYIYAFSTSADRKAYITTYRTQKSPTQMFENEKRMLEKSANRKGAYNNDFYKKELKDFINNKEEYIKQKTHEKATDEKLLTLLHRYSSEIYSTLDKVREQLLNTSPKASISFEGDIKNGFVIGTFSDDSKVILIHKDTFVEQPEAVYASVLNKEQYDKLIADNKLVFNKKFRDTVFENSSNFWNYGQFLNEIKDPYVQEFFLGKKYNLLDNSTLPLIEKKTSKKTGKNHSM